MLTKKQINAVEAEKNWEVKPRNYYLTRNRKPVTFTLKSKHTDKYPLLWFDPEKNEQRALRYATNQNTPFQDEQKGEVTLGHIMFRDGSLMVPKEHQALQKLLSIYHPDNGLRYNEFKPAEIAKDELVDLEVELMAMNVAKQMEIEQVEAILRVEHGSEVLNLSSKELRRDVLIFARNEPRTFIALAQDENVMLRNFGLKAMEQQIIDLSPDQKTFKWKKNGKKLMTVHFDENPYTALAAWFKTDEGVAVYKSIEKKIS